MNEVLGVNFVLMGNLMKAFLDDKWSEFIVSAKSDKWYPAEKLIMLLADVERSAGTEKILACGKGIYFTIRDAVEKMGVKTPLEAIQSIVGAYPFNNRGPSVGGWRLLNAEEGHIIIEDNTIYNCALGEGVVQGAIKAFGGRDVKVKHIKCKKRGDSSCVNEATWK